MSTDTDAPENGRMVKIDARVPASVLEEIDEEYERRGYASRSEAIRDALRDWLNPSVTLSEETIDALETSREQRERGETRSLDDVDEAGVGTITLSVFDDPDSRVIVDAGRDSWEFVINDETAYSRWDIGELPEWIDQSSRASGSE